MQRIDEQALIEWVTTQRWFGSKSRAVAHASVTEAVELRTTAPRLDFTLVEIRFQPGTHEIYQVLVGERPREDGWSAGVIAETKRLTLYDAFVDPMLARELVQLMRSGSTSNAHEGQIEFRTLGTIGETGMDVSEARPVGVEQSNTSVVFDDALILKSYRRLEAGINPDLELLRFLTEVGFPNIPALHGWYAYAGRLIDATLGVLQAYVPNARDGWELTLDELESDPDGVLELLRRLGEVSGDLHTALASDQSDPAFAPEDPSPEALGLLTATVDEEIEQIFLDLPDDMEELEPIRGRGEEVRERLRMLTHIGPVGRIIRHHGDYHLGQTLWDGRDWVIIDFEGEPARPLPERRRKRSPLRDVAGMLRSFAYAALAADLQRGVVVPDGWEERARDGFLAGYRETAERSLLPASDEGFEKLLSVFELEKAVYELRYELNHRPDWVRIPVAGILRLLEAPLPA